MVQTAGRHKFKTARDLDHAEHDRADKSECYIGGNNAQSAQSHGIPPGFTSLPALTMKASKTFPVEKVSATVYRAISTARHVLKSRKINPLKSP
jgi:hypothetical protein